MPASSSYILKDLGGTCSNRVLKIPCPRTQSHMLRAQILSLTQILTHTHTCRPSRAARFSIESENQSNETDIDSTSSCNNNCRGPTLREKSRMTLDTVNLNHIPICGNYFGKSKMISNSGRAKSNCVHRVIVFHCRILDFCAWFATLWCVSQNPLPPSTTNHPIPHIHPLDPGQGCQPSYLCQKVLLMLVRRFSSLEFPPLTLLPDSYLSMAVMSVCPLATHYTPLTPPPIVCVHWEKRILIVKEK